MPEHYQFTLEWETSERANALEQAAMEGESPVANLVTKLSAFMLLSLLGIDKTSNRPSSSRAA